MIFDAVLRDHMSSIDDRCIVSKGKDPDLSQFGQQQLIRPRLLRPIGCPRLFPISCEAMDKDNA